MKKGDPGTFRTNIKFDELPVKAGTIIVDAADELLNIISNSCCNVCDCENGIKVWCACHRKQIKDFLEEEDKNIRDEIDLKLIQSMPSDAENLSTLTNNQAKRTIDNFLKS